MLHYFNDIFFSELQVQSNQKVQWCSGRVSDS